MRLVSAATGAVERLPIPDRLARAGIAALVGRTARRLGRASAAAEADFAAAMAAHPIALHPEAANRQHYELPPEFFTHVLGAQRKYSCCYFDTAATTLDAAETRALELTASHAGLADGQRILELGCGWGALTLWMARRYRRAEIVAVSNSAPQRGFIEAAARAEGLANLRVITADMNDFTPAAHGLADRFDRIVSVEMWEHMANWTALLRRVHAWLRPDGALFLHVFSHRRVPYRFDHTNRGDWIAQHFFTGGIMPSHDLIRHLDAPFRLAEDWRWSGEHYRRTAECWLERYDANAGPIAGILRSTYGADWRLWQRRWRMFFLATSGLFGALDGAEWGVSHYRLVPE